MGGYGELQSDPDVDLVYCLYPDYSQATNDQMWSLVNSFLGDGEVRAILAEALAAPEAFLTSTTSFVRGIVGIDGTVIGDGTPGPISRRLRGLYLDYCRGAGSNA